MTYAASIEDVRAAAARIAPHAHRTPVVTCQTLDAMAGARLFLKCEHLQKVGAFKFRGACNAVMQLPAEVAQRGVVTHSSGNHAQALALAARMRGVPAHIVMPRTALEVKKRAVRGYGAEVIECEPHDAARSGTANEVAERTGGVIIPPYDHPHIIAGQGTAALELIEDAGPLDAIIAPVGGGGLVSGTCITARGIDERLDVIAAEPARADDAARSIATGELQPPITPPATICDGLLTGMGEHTWPIIRDHIKQVVTIEDDRVIEVMRLVWERTKLLIEPSAAVAIAVALEPVQRRGDYDRIGVIISGGNVDLDRLPWQA